MHNTMVGKARLPAKYKRTKAGFNATAIMHSRASLYADSLGVFARDGYENNLEYGDGANPLCKAADKTIQVYGRI